MRQSPMAKCTSILPPSTTSQSEAPAQDPGDILLESSTEMDAPKETISAPKTAAPTGKEPAAAPATVPVDSPVDFAEIRVPRVAPVSIWRPPTTAEALPECLLKDICVMVVEPRRTPCNQGLSSDHDMAKQPRFGG